MLNEFIGVGRLVREPELKELEKGSVCNFTIAIQRSYKNSDGLYDTDFIDCSLFNVAAERLVKYCKKGDLIGIIGQLKIDTYINSEDKKVNKAIIQVSKVSFLSSKKDVTEEA